MRSYNKQKGDRDFCVCHFISPDTFLSFDVLEEQNLFLLLKSKGNQWCMGTSEVFYRDARSILGELKACHMLVYERQMRTCQVSSVSLFVNSGVGCK